LLQDGCWSGERPKSSLKLFTEQDPLEPITQVGLYLSSSAFLRGWVGVKLVRHAGSLTEGIPALKGRVLIRQLPRELPGKPRAYESFRLYRAPLEHVTPVELRLLPEILGELGELACWSQEWAIIRVILVPKGTERLGYVGW